VFIILEGVKKDVHVMKTEMIEKSDFDFKLLVDNIEKENFEVQRFAGEVKLLKGVYLGNLGYQISFAKDSVKLWSEEQKNKLKSVFNQTNKETDRFEFVINNFSDRELEWDRDRIFPASVDFFVINK